MSSIPLVALGVNNPQAENPLQAQERMQQMRGQAQQQELVKRQIADQDAMTRALHDWDASKGDYGALSASVLRNGGSGDAAFKVMQHGLAVKKQVSDIAKQDAETGGTQLANLATRHDQALGAIKAAEDVPDDQLGAHVTSTITGLVQSGMLKPEEAQPYAQLALLPPDQMRQQLKLHEKQLQGEKAQIAQAATEQEMALKKAQAGQAEAATGEAQAKTKQIQQQTTFGPQGEAAEAKYADILGRLRANQPVTPQEYQWAQGYELSLKKTTTSSDSLGVTSTNTSGPTGLASAAPKAAGTGGGGTRSGGAAAPSAKQSLVDEIGQYRVNPTMITRLLVRHPDILGMIQQKYPDFDQTNYNAKNQLMTKYTSGPQSKEIAAINTVASHLSILNDAVDALNNGSVPALNALANKVGAAVGQTPQTTFRTIVHRVGPEITGAYVQGGGGETERFANAEDFSENKAPQQLKDNIGITVKLLRGKIGALENNYKQTVGRDDFQQRFITPEASRSFNALAPPSGGSASATRVYQGHNYAQQPDGSWKLQ